MVLLWESLPLRKDGNNSQNNISKEAAAAFQTELTSRGIQKIGQPIEGFDANILMQAFPGLKDFDVDNVESFEGVHEYENKLVWKSIQNQTIASAEKMMLTRGYQTLLGNLSERLSMPASTKEQAIAIIDTID